MHMIWDEALSHPSLRFSDDGRAVASDDSYHTVDGIHHTRVALGKDLLANDVYQVKLVYVGGSRAFLCAGVCQVDAPHLHDRRGKLLNTWSLQGSRSTHRSCWLYSFYHNKFSADGADWESLAKRSSKSTAEDGTIFDPGDALVIELSLQTGSLSFSRQAGCREGGTRIGRMSVARGRFRFIALLGGMMGCVSFGPDAADPGRVLGTDDADTLSLRRQMLAKRTCDLVRHAHTF